MGPGALPCPLKPIKSQMITLPFLKPLPSLSLCLNRNPKSLYSPVTRPLPPCVLTRADTRTLTLPLSAQTLP